jgi:hypothetical protein
VNNDFIPSITSLRRDPAIVAQAEQLVADVGTNIAGNSVSSNSNVKRGLGERLHCYCTERM